MSGGGFSFANTAAGQSTTGGFGGTSGFSFGQTANKNAVGASTGLGGTFGTPTAGFGAAGAVGTANPAPSTTTLGGGGFNFGGAASSTAATAATQPAATTVTGGLGGVGFGGLGGTAAKTTAPATGFGATTGLAGFGATSTPSLATTTAGTTGFSLGGGLGATTAAKPGLTLGGFGTTTTTAGDAKTTAATGFGFGGLGTTATTKPGLTLGGFGTTTSAASTGFSLGGGLGGTTAGSSLGSSVFAATATTTASKGLGGVDPKTTTATTGISGTNGKPGDSKAVKETAMPNEITITVEEFKKYVKQQRTVREEIDRMSSKPMYKVQEEVASLKQWLSLVSTSLQRNAIAIDKLKQESAQELKNAEIAQRTKDLPAGLQYENTAPSEYFARMLDDFESRMVLYRQQIEEMESHLASLQQPAMLTPQELSMLLKKIYESFIHLAAQLQVIHEAVKAQKNQYLNYRKVFHGDSTDIFEKRRKAAEKARTGRPEKIVGPTPFTGMSNAAAMAMATALNRAQQPTGGAPTLGLNTGLGTTGLTGQTGGLGTGLGAGSIFGSTGTGTAGAAFGSTGFGSTTQQPQQTGFGSTSFNFGATNTATVRPLGSTFGSTGSTAGAGLFGSTTAGVGAGTTGGFGFGGAQTTGGFGAQPAASGALNLSTSATFGAAPQDNKQPFLLQKPPAGNKKGKKT